MDISRFLSSPGGLRLSKRSARALLLAFFIFALSSLRLHADGPGIGNLTYGAGELFSTLARFESVNGAPRGHGFVAMHRGYLVVPFSADGGGGNGTGGFAFYNVGDPRSPQLTFTTEGNAAYSSGSPNYAGHLREPHG